MGSRGVYNFYKGRVDNVIRLPFGKNIMVMCTSEDVIHGFRVPGLGLKIDCIPGRINATKIFERKSGVYFGQCHVLCGTHHSSIPIRVEIISRGDFLSWLQGKRDVPSIYSSAQREEYNFLAGSFEKEGSPNSW